MRQEGKTKCTAEACKSLARDGTSWEAPATVRFVLGSTKKKKIVFSSSSVCIVEPLLRALNPPTTFEGRDWCVEMGTRLLKLGMWKSCPPPSSHCVFLQPFCSDVLLLNPQDRSLECSLPSGYVYALPPMNLLKPCISLSSRTSLRIQCFVADHHSLFHVLT